MTIFIILHLLVCCFLVLVILLQPGKGDAGIGFGSSSQSIFGSKGAGNFLTKTTSVCAIVFLSTSFLLTRERIQEATSSVIRGDEPAAQAPATPAAEPAKDAAKPAAEAPKADAPKK
ncbi:preprotein translocase subunit SecG [bacterium]|nr:preprotein translocase subunit SecG [bacterium]